MKLPIAVLLSSVALMTGCQSMNGLNDGSQVAESIENVGQPEARIESLEGVRLKSVDLENRPNNTPGHIRWVKYKPVPFSPATKKSLPANTANLVFFRQQDDRNEQTAVNVGINDRYQASLRGGNYTAIPSCAGDTVISTLITNKKSNDLEIEPNKYTTDIAVNYYYEVFVDDLGNSQAAPVAEAYARKQLKSKELQTHTISRVVQKDCAAPIVTEKKAIKLYGIYYFPFDKSQLIQTEIDKASDLAQKILNSGYADYEVVLAGHADPMGNVKYNQGLSDRRVATVSRKLQLAGIDPKRIRQAAFGETKPLTLNCMDIGKRSTRNNCNRQNRRVEAHVTLKP